MNELSAAPEPTSEQSTKQSIYFVIGAREALAAINEKREDAAKQKNKPVKGKLRTPSDWLDYFSGINSVPVTEKIFQSGIQSAIAGKGFFQRAKAETVMNTIHNACVKLRISPIPILSIGVKEVLTDTTKKK